MKFGLSYEFMEEKDATKQHFLLQMFKDTVVETTVLSTYQIAE